MKLVILCVLFFCLSAFAGPLNMTYQGRLFTQGGSAIDSGSSEVKLQILSPVSECLLYEETHTLSMDGTDGYFSVLIGLGVKNIISAPNFDLLTVFSNSTTISDPTMNCTGNSYTPSGTDARLLRVSVDGETLSPDHIMNSTPFSLNADEAAKLEGKSLSVIESDYQDYADQNLAGFSLPDLQASPLSAGDSFQWDGAKWVTFQAAPADLPSNSVTLDDLSFASVNGINMPQLSTDPGSAAAGQTYYNTTSNKLMVYNGTSWVDSTGTASPWAASGGNISFTGGNAGVGTVSPQEMLDVNGIIQANGTIRIDNSGTLPNAEVIAFQSNDSDMGQIMSYTTDNLASDLIFHTASGGALGERMRIDSAGNIGLGTFTPDSNLHVYDSVIPSIHLESARTSGSFFNTIEFDAPSMPVPADTRKFRMIHYAKGGTEQAALEFRAENDDESYKSSVLWLEHDGNVGVGTGNPSSKLEVAGEVKAQGIRFTDGTVQTTAAQNAGSIIYEQKFSGRWLHDNATWFGPRAKSLQGMKVDIGAGAAANEKIFEYLIAPAGTLSNSKTYTVELQFMRELQTSDNDMVVAICDDDSGLGFMQADSSNGKNSYINDFLDGATHTGNVQTEGGNVTVSARRGQATILLDDSTYVISWISDSAAPAVATSTRVLSRDQSLKLCVFGGDIAETYGVYWISVKIIQEP